MVKSRAGVRNGRGCVRILAHVSEGLRQEAKYEPLEEFAKKNQKVWDGAGEASAGTCPQMSRGSLLPLRRSSWYAAAVYPHEHTLSFRGILRYVSVKTFDLDSIILAALRCPNVRQVPH
jgi:hypothetical protein